MPKKAAAAKKKKPAERPVQAPRQLYLPKRRWYKPLTWRFAPPVPDYKPLPKARLLFVHAMQHVWQHKWLFAGIVAFYGVFDILLVRGLSGGADISQLKGAIDSAVHGAGGKVVSSVASFGYLIATSGGSSSQGTIVYQYLLLLFCSLAFIWALRQTLAGHKIRIRDAFYQGMYPLIPFLLVLLVISIQLLPLVGGGALYTLALSGGIAITWWEKALFLVVFIGLLFWTLRMITSSVLALYIVTLPNMEPMHALRSAKGLVYGRRLLLWRKLLFLPAVLLLLAAVIELPLILFLTPLASWAFFLISMAALPISHAYLYALYREML
jgi:hypothetical protein